MLVKMLDAGMNVARLNFSHGDHKTHGQSLENLQEALKQRPEKTCAVMLDTKGPEIRTGFNRDNKPIDIATGQSIKIVTDPAIEGDSTKIACTYKNLPKTVSVGSTIFIADGSLTCEVSEVHDVSSTNNFIFFQNTGSYCCYLQKCYKTWRAEKHEFARSYCRSPNSHSIG